MRGGHGQRLAGGGIDSDDDVMEPKLTLPRHYRMTMFRGLSLAVLSMITLTACNHAPDAATTAPIGSASVAASPATSVTLIRAGGFAGRQQTLDVTPDGQWSFASGEMASGGGAPQRGQLSDSDRARLFTLVADPRLVSEAARTAGSGKCADTYRYDLAVGSLRVAGDDCDRQRTPALMEIITLLAAATAF